MAIYFVRTTTLGGGSAPSNSNTGRDPIGFGLTTATYDDTGNGEGERHLSSTGAFTSYSWTAGDLIYLSGGAGITPGLYEIAARVDADAILLTTSAGSDSTSDVTSSNGPWLTVQFAMDTATGAGDEVRICAGGTFTPAAQVDMDTAFGTATAPITYTGATARGVVDGTKATISAASLGATANLFQTGGAGTVGYWYLRHLNLIGGGGGQDIIFNNFRSHYMCVDRCILDSAVRDGWRTDGAGTYLLVDSEVKNCAGAGLNMVSTPDGCWNIMRCSIHDNVGNGVLVSATLSQTFSCLQSHIYDNGGHGLHLQDVTNTGRSHSIIEGCNFQANTSDGLRITNSGNTHVFNSIFRSNGGYGINVVTTATMLQTLRHCCFSNNTSGATNQATTPGDGHITSDPQFTSETDGAEDFTLAASSPCIDAGLEVGTA